MLYLYCIYIIYNIYIYTQHIYIYIPPSHPPVSIIYTEACTNLQTVWWLYKAHQTVEQGTHVFTASWNYGCDPMDGTISLLNPFLPVYYFFLELQNTKLHKDFDILSWSILITCYVPILLVMKVLLSSTFPSLTNPQLQGTRHENSTKASQAHLENVKEKLLRISLKKQKYYHYHSSENPTSLKFLHFKNHPSILPRGISHVFSHPKM